MTDRDFHSARAMYGAPPAPFKDPFEEITSVQDTQRALAAAWCDDFQRAMTWLCSPEPTVTIPLKEYERLKAADDALRRRREADAKLPRNPTWDQARLYK